MALVLGGGNPLRRVRVAAVNRALILTSIFAFVFGLPPEPFAFVPAYVLGAPGVSAPTPSWPLWRGLIGHVFIHGDWVHLASNMIALWVFGDNVEDAMGHWRYLIFYFLCAIGGALAEGMMTAEPMRPLIGASGAISGVMGAYLLLHPHAKILVLLLLRVPVLLPASVVVAGDIAANLTMALAPQFSFASSALDSVAWGAHLGGFATGLALVAPFKGADVPLFHPPGAYPPVPFPRLQRVLVDFFPPPDPLGQRAGWLDRLMVGVKAAAYLALVALLFWTL